MSVPAVASRRPLSKRSVSGRAPRRVQSRRGKWGVNKRRRAVGSRRRVVVGKRLGGGSTHVKEISMFGIGHVIKNVGSNSLTGKVISIEPDEAKRTSGPGTLYTE